MGHAVEPYGVTDRWRFGATGRFHARCEFLFHCSSGSEPSMRGPAVLSIEHCRRLLPQLREESDKDVSRIREQLYKLAGLFIESSSGDAGKRSDPPKPTHLVTDLLEEMEERAAIMEFDGEMTRQEAERAALASALDKQVN